MTVRKVCYVLGIAAILAFALLVVFLECYLRLTYDLQKEMREYFGLVLPQEAANVHYKHWASMNYFALLRFDVPEGAIEGFLSSNSDLPRLSDFAESSCLNHEMAMPGVDVEWWTLKDAQKPYCGMTSGRVVDRRGHVWKWSFMVRIEDLGDTNRRLYVLYEENPYVSTVGET